MFREARKVDRSGKALLVKVDDLEKRIKYSISINKKMFACPDCGEFVGFVYGRNKSSYFVHKKSDGTRKCEIYVKRINSNQTYTPYQRAGLPLYLLRTEKSYCISIGFYPISKQALDTAIDNKISLTVCTDRGSKIITKYINEESFSSDTTSFIQIDKLSNKYQLRFSINEIPPDIAKKWVGEIEGIENNGCFFKYNEYGGIKVRKSESIIAGVNYYLACRYDPTKLIENIVCEKVGEMSLETDSFRDLTFYIYKVRFTDITDQNSLFCQEKYNVLLVYNSPELNPLWPPCNKREQTYIYEHKQDAGFLLKMSEQIERKVFIYSEKQAVINVLDKNRAITFIPVDETERPVSIERVGSIFAFTVVSGKREKNVLNSEVIAEDEKFNVFSYGENAKLPYNNRIRLKTGFRGSIYVFYNGDLKHIKVADGIVWLDNIRYGILIEVFHGLDSVFILEFKRPKKSRHIIEEAFLHKELAAFIRKNYVSTPASFKYILPRVVDNPMLSEYVKKVLKSGYIDKMVMHKITRYIRQLTLERGQGV